MFYSGVIYYCLRTIYLQYDWQKAITWCKFVSDSLYIGHIFYASMIQSRFVMQQFKYFIALDWLNVWMLKYISFVVHKLSSYWILYGFPHRKHSLNFNSFYWIPNRHIVSTQFTKPRLLLAGFLAFLLKIFLPSLSSEQLL